MSEDGYKKLMAELKELETVERPKISAAIAEARDKGGISSLSKSSFSAVYTLSELRLSLLIFILNLAYAIFPAFIIDRKSVV